jgi:very-short-patch-repair endonuclease
MTNSSPPRIKLAKRMRSSPSVSEAELWRLLRGRRLDGLKFRRRVPLGPCVVDFLCLRHRLIVEADGPFHGDDSKRDAWLEGQGFNVLRFENSLIFNRAERVLELILDAVSAQAVDPESGLSGWE